MKNRKALTPAHDASMRMAAFTISSTAPTIPSSSRQIDKPKHPIHLPFKLKCLCVVALETHHAFAMVPEVEVIVKKLSVALLGIAIVSTAIISFTAPASALGGCGPNGHRNGWGHCVFGGQNQAWCIRKTGHPATRMPDGTLRCL